MPGSLVLSKTVDGVTTLTMNNPSRLNGWTMEMLVAVKNGLREAADDDATKVVILTGADPYYCAGVNLSSTLGIDHPKKIHAMIVENNQALFDTFIEFPKPILVAANGPAIGACVTSATLCNGIIASQKATFSTPFAALGVPPEGCSSAVFPKLLGDAAERMLGKEGWKPTAEEAKEVGLVQWVVPHEQLLDEAERIAREWIEKGEPRRYPANMTREELLAVNARESVEVATAFLSPPFLMGQFRFLWGKKKRPPALMFLALRATHPVWSRML